MGNSSKSEANPHPPNALLFESWPQGLEEGTLFSRLPRDLFPVIRSYATRVPVLGGTNFKFQKILFDYPKEPDGYVMSMAIDRLTGNILCSDYTKSRVRVHDSEGNFLFKIGSPGKQDGQFTRVWGMTVNARGDIIVVDPGNSRIQTFTSKGQFRSKFEVSPGSPTGCCVDNEGNILVCLDSADCVCVYTAEGEFIRKFGSHGNNDGHFCSPVAVTVDPDTSNIIVADHGQKVQIFNSQGKYLRRFGASGAGKGAFFTYPYDVLVDGKGTLLVSDHGNNRVSIFDSEGTFLSQFGAPPGCVGEIKEPTGLAIDNSGNLLVADSKTTQVQLWVPDN